MQFCKRKNRCLPDGISDRYTISNHPSVLRKSQFMSISFMKNLIWKMDIMFRIKIFWHCITNFRETSQKNKKPADAKQTCDRRSNKECESGCGRRSLTEMHLHPKLVTSWLIPEREHHPDKTLPATSYPHHPLNPGL